MEKPVSVVNENLRQTQQRASDAAQRYIWTSAAANGAALLAYSNIVANVSSPDLALAALTGPLLLSGAGIVCGSFAVVQTIHREWLQSSIDVEDARMEYALSRLRNGWPVLLREMPMSMEVARLVHGDQAENEVRKLLHELLSKQPEKDEKDNADFSDAVQRKSALIVQQGVHADRATKFHITATYLLAVSVIWAVLQHFAGVTLQAASPPPKPAAPVVQPRNAAPLPASPASSTPAQPRAGAPSPVAGGTAPPPPPRSAP